MKQNSSSEIKNVNGFVTAFVGAGSSDVAKTKTISNKLTDDTKPALTYQQKPFSGDVPRAGYKWFAKHTTHGLINNQNKRTRPYECEMKLSYWIGGRTC